MDEKRRRDRFEKMLGGKRFDVESTLNIYASNFVTLPAAYIYDSAALDQVKEQTKPCHIYLIGLLPKVEFVGCAQSGDTLITSYTVAGKPHDLDWPVPPAHGLKGDGG